MADAKNTPPPRHWQHSIFLFALLSLQASAFAKNIGDEGVPALRVVSPNGATNILIGSLHIPAAGLRQPADSVMNDAKAYLVENLPEPDFKSELDSEIAPKVLRGESQRAHWAKPLTDVQIERLSRNVGCTFVEQPVLENRDIDLYLRVVILTLKSASLATTYAIRPCASTGLLSRDIILKRAATKHGIPTFALETRAQVNQQRMAVPEEIYRYQLFKAFTPESREGLLRTVNALNSGAYEEILNVLEHLAKTPADAQTYNRLMIAERNYYGLPKLREYLDQGNAVVNVGAAHLAGPDGLIALLSKSGYKISPLPLRSTDDGANEIPSKKHR